MGGALIDLAASVLVTAAVMLLPGMALVGVLGAFTVIDPLLRPAAAVAGTIALSSVALALTLWLHWSIMGYGLAMLLATLVLGIVALLRFTPSRGMVGRGERARSVLGWVPPTIVLLVVGIFDAPQVRSDTYWHVALARKLGAFEHLSSARISFEAGAPGNPNYPLPSWHALISLADHAPRVDLWSATWFLTLWLAPVAMLAF
ncbi:MAG: hypothetical protein JWM86_396, partial [Thermoleophilia bacterium]|nr:hypothetical protein [Thermoleophilia bacterium]